MPGSHDRQKVTCFTKDNIMKLTDGLVPQGIRRDWRGEYPDIENEHWIVDIGAAKLADTPGEFDVMVMPNLYGDVLSDVAAQIAGSVGLAGSANIGAHCAMFEAIHGSAPRRAGLGHRQPIGPAAGWRHDARLHIGQPEAAEKVHNAWLKTIEDGVHTYDIYKEGVSKENVGNTKRFAQGRHRYRLGRAPQVMLQRRHLYQERWAV
jgi:isocitrate dehydrogenase